MVKKSSIKAIFSLLFAIILAFTLNINNKAFAQENRLLVSPSFKILEFDSGVSISEKVTVKNNYQETITVKASPTLVRISENENPQILEDSDITSNITLDTTSIELLPNQSFDFEFTIKNPDTFTDSIYPAIKIEPINADSSDPVSIGSALISTFIIENSNSTLEFDLNVDIQKIEVWGNEVKIDGIVENTGSRSFTPTGNIIVSKGNTNLENFELTSEINKLLLPGKSVEFSKQFTIQNENLNYFERLGNYDFETTVSPNPYTTDVSNSQSLLIIPIEIYIFAFLAATLVFISIIFVTKNKLKK